ncbi:hypothetical protein [Bacteroides sp. 51]|uniref:hypothetical protein n=1 Tax=Bacteroides sp. 51 TaxID=2302938 RepID=UPI0013D02FA2|nr:hypothetical protein [Bacteroides sp. 51]
MARIIKSILFLLLVVVLHVSANDGMVKENLYEGGSIPCSSQQYSWDNIKLPYLPDGELGSIGFCTQQPISSRTNRTNFDGSAFSLRDMAQIMSEREGMLFCHWEKLYSKSLLFSITHPVSEYYVFALKHIII